MDNYIVEIWKMEGRIRQHSPDFISENIIARSPELALSKVLSDNKIMGKVYAEVLWNEGRDRQKFEDYELRV
jgi:hypothetical protein